MYPSPRFLFARVLLAGMIASAFACRSEPPVPEAPANVDARAALMDADRAFATETAARGLEGWMSAYAADAVRLRMGETAVQGLESIRAFDAALFTDSTARLVWIPTDGGAFTDGRHGFTTGRSAIVRVGTSDTLYRGRYVTLWRRNADGQWKVILDTGT